MAQVIKEIQVEVSKPNFFQAIVAKQFDSQSRWLRVTMVDNGEKITVADSSTVTINARRSDGGENKFVGSVDKGKGTVLVPLAYWMLELEGTVKSDVSVTDSSGRVLTTTNFTIEVERASCQSGNVSPDDADVDILQGLINEVSALKGDIVAETTYDPESSNAMSGIAVAQAIQNVTINTDDKMSDTSENPVQNKVIKGYVDDAVSRVDVGITENGKNLIDESKLETGGLTSAGVDNDVANSFKRTEYIYLETGSYIYSNKGNAYTNFRVCIYDLSKNFERTQAGAGKNAFTIDSPKYVRIHDLGSMKEKQLELGTTPTEYEPYYKKIKDEYLGDVYEEIAETDGKVEGAVASANEVSIKLENMLETGKNLYDNTKKTNGLTCSDTSGAIAGKVAGTTTSSSHALSDWIEVESGATYVLTCSKNTSYRVQIADENEVLVVNYFTIANNKPIEIPTLPEGSEKIQIRFATSQTYMDITQFEKGDTSTTYEEYKKSLKPEFLPTVAQKNWFEGKTILFDGDSITAGTGLTPVTQAYPYLVCKELNANIINKAIGGSALASKPDNETRNPLVLRYDTQVTDEVAETVDLVYIAIGSNDWAYGYTELGTMEDRVPTTFYGALHLLCEGLLNKYAGKPIIFATPIKRRLKSADTTPDSALRNGKTLKEYGEIIKEVCNFYSIPVLDMYGECCLTPFIDNHIDLYFQEEFETATSITHPNSDGAKIMARRVVAGLRSIVGF